VLSPITVAAVMVLPPPVFSASSVRPWRSRKVTAPEGSATRAVSLLVVTAAEPSPVCTSKPVGWQASFTIVIVSRAKKAPFGA
jgi:hypothetical protein